MTRIARNTVVLAAASVLASASVAQSPLLTLYGSTPGDDFGADIVVMGDLDADGRPEFAVSGAVSGTFRVVTIRSGFDGSIVRAFSGPSADNYGNDIAAPGDVDGDGVPDLLVGSPGNDAFGTNSGQAFVYSGASGAEVRAVHGGGSNWGAGTRVFAAGDQDGDNKAEFVVDNGGRFRVYSGATGLQRYQVTSPAIDLARSVQGIGDVSGDGVPDLAVGEPFTPLGAPGQIEILSGVDGAWLRTIVGPEGGDEFGRMIVPVPDANADGVPDMLVAAPARTSTRGRVLLLSGSNGAILLQVQGLTGFDHLGYGLAGGQDLDGDGVHDILAIADDYFTAQPYRQYAAAFSGSSGALMTLIPIATKPISTSYACAILGDIDGDNRREFCFGVIHPPGIGPGQVVVYRGPTVHEGVLGTAMCFGDGSGAPCPCANSGAIGNGCDNSVAGGGRLSAFGSASIAADDTAFDAVNLPTSTAALLFTGAPIAAVSFGDGLRCAGSPIRLGVGSIGTTGERVWGPSLLSLGGWSAGVTRVVQAVYRNVTGPCGSEFNTTNGVSVTFVP